MSLTVLGLARVEATEARQERMQRLQRMSHYELRALLTGDPAEAATWVTSAAEYGLPAEQLDGEAMNMVGRCHDNGWGADATLAAHWYRRSAERGHDWGQYNLGNALFDGIGTRRDGTPEMRRTVLDALSRFHHPTLAARLLTGDGS